MIELKLRNIVRKVKSKNPQKRYEALDHLYHLKIQEGLVVRIELLKEIIKTATFRFPERVDHWDNPSFFLIDFACDFPMKEVASLLLKHFEGFDLLAKERAIEYLIATEQDEVFNFLEEKIVQLIHTEDFILPLKELSTYPVLIKGILDQTLEKLSSNHYKFMIYDLLLSLNIAGYEQDYQKERVIPFLLKDYQTEKQEYLKFDRNYSAKFVYTAWKDSYLAVRNRMRILISLMEYYSSPEIETELKIALDFNDPLIKSNALLVCVARDLPYQENTLLDCAQNIESSEMIYWELKEKNIEHLYPIREGKQPLLAKTRLFSTIINLTEEENGATHFTENIQILDQVEMDNPFGQPTRYYLMRFYEHGHDYVGWAGGYSLVDGNDEAGAGGGTFTDFADYDSSSLEGHKEAFYKKRAEEIHEYENTVFFESAPKLGRSGWFLLAMMITRLIRAAFSNFSSALLPAIVLCIAGGSWVIYQLLKNKQRKISIVGKHLVMKDGSRQHSIELNSIKKVEYDKKHVLVYNKNNELALKFPLGWVRYEVFYFHMKEHTGHFKDSPRIQQ
ncbi:MAG: hypothetical protein Q8898_06930 [Bacillota bacterium]|nr:hypothetical protein [Bacillota bacterium]